MNKFDVEKFWRKKKKGNQLYSRYRKFFFHGYFVLFNGFMHILRHKLSRDIVEKILIYAFPWVNVHCLASFYSCPRFLDRERVIRWRHDVFPDFSITQMVRFLAKRNETLGRIPLLSIQLKKIRSSKDFFLFFFFQDIRSREIEYGKKKCLRWLTVING